MKVFVLQQLYVNWIEENESQHTERIDKRKSYSAFNFYFHWFDDIILYGKLYSMMQHRY